MELMKLFLMKSSKYLFQGRVSLVLGAHHPGLVFESNKVGADGGAKSTATSGHLHK